MPDSYLISVGVKADFSELKTEQKAAQDAVKTATENMKAAYAELGQAAGQGSAQAVEALKIYENELAQAQARAAAATGAFTAGQTAAGNAAAHTVPQFVAASGAIRVLEGNMTNNVRAAERFLTSTLGLGPVLQAAFPLVGALAFGGVIFEVGKKLVEFAMQAQDLATDLGVGWLDGALAQMTGLGAVVKQTNEELMKLAGSMDSIKNKGNSDLVERVRLTQGQAAATRETARQLGEQLAALEKIVPTQRAAVKEAAGRTDAFSNVEGEMGALKAVKDKELAEEQLRNTLAQQAEIKFRMANLDIKAGQEQKAEDTKAAKGDTSAETKAEAAAAKARAARMHADELEYNQLRMTHTLTLKEEAAFWQQRLDTFGGKTSEYAAITSRLAEIYTKGAAEAHKSIEAFKKEQEKLATEAANELAQLSEGIKKYLREQDEDLTHTGERWKSYNEELARGLEIEAANTAHLDEAKVAFNLATGAITQQAAAHQMAAIHAKEYADQLKILEAELERIKHDGALSPEQKATETASVNNKIAQNKGASAVSGVADQTKQATAFEKPWTTAFHTIQQQWLSTMDSVLKGQISIARGAQQLGSETLLAVVNSLAKQEMARVADYARDKIQHLLHITSKKAVETAADAGKVASATATTAAITAVDTSADAVKLASGVAANLALALSYAGVAAAAAYASTAAIPIVGPVLAPGVAAGSYAAAMGFAALASFDVGGVVGGRIGSAVPILAHGGERVLTSQQTATFERMVAGGSSTRGSSAIHSTNTFNGVSDAKTFQKLIGKHERTLALTLKRSLRNGRF